MVMTASIPEAVARREETIQQTAFGFGPARGKNEKRLIDIRREELGLAAVGSRSTQRVLSRIHRHHDPVFRRHLGDHAIADDQPGRPRRSALPFEPTTRRHHQSAVTDLDPHQRAMDGDDGSLDGLHELGVYAGSIGLTRGSAPADAN